MADLSADEKSAAMRERIRKHAVRPFDLETGPLLRLELLILGEQEHVLLFNMHHIISDGWSIGILLREWTEIHTALAEEREPELRPLPVQYSDYVAWQRQSLNEDVVERRLARWTEELTGAPQLLELPTDHPRPPVQSYRGAHLESRIDADLTAWLHELGMKKNSTLFMTLLAVFGVLLHKYSGQDDILIGSPTANRTQSQIEDLIGFFVNTLVLRARFEKGMSFSALLAQVRRTALEAFAYQDLPFERLVERLAPERSLSCSPLFQVMFALQNNEEGELVLPGLETELLEQDFPTAKFDLTLNAAERDGGLILHWEYAVDLFEEATIRRMSEHFAVLLKGIVEQPEVDISSLPLLTAAETEQLIAWNDTTTEYPADRTLADLFEEQAAKTPENIAVVFPSAGSGRAEDQQLTYRELNEKANQLAHALLELGVQADTLVGICAERSLEMITGLLGILKAGGAYVPLDPDYPEERLRFILEDCGAQILLTQTRLHDRLPGLTGKMIDLDDPQRYAGWTTENPQRCCGPENLAYVIYTSGSTGRPKGVMVEQGNVINILYSYEGATSHSDPFEGMAVSPFSFDVAVWEYFSVLCFGGALHILQREQFVDPENLAGYIRARQIHSAYIPPALLAGLRRHLRRSEWSLQRLLVGVESIRQGLLQDYRDLAGDSAFHIINGYGPTETAICSSFHVFQEATERDGNTPIGQPIANTRIYILDATLRPLPLGIPGELCIAGDGLARGYLNRPDLTAEKFVEVKIFGKTERIYRTGDLARWLPDGNLEYLGRMDHQVKLRGFRIELGEIEAALTRHEAVSSALVVLHEREGNKSLAAYVTVSGRLDRDAAALSTELHGFLKESLPDYMVPSSFTVLEKMPLTPNGKIDRKALPDPKLNENARGAYVAPGNTQEQQLALIWEAVLQTAPVGIHDNFFDLGGTSISVLTLLNRIQQYFGRDLSLAMLFQAQTVAEQAKIVQQKRQGSAWTSLVPIRASGEKKTFFLIPGGGGGHSEFIIYEGLARQLDTEQPVYMLLAQGLDDGRNPHTTVEEMASDYLDEIRLIQPEGPYLLGGECIGGTVAFEMARQLRAKGEEVGLLVLMDTAYPTGRRLFFHHLVRSWINRVRQHRATEYLVGNAKKNIRKIVPGTPPKEVSPEMQFKNRKRMFKKNYIEVTKNYRKKFYSGRLVLLLCEENYTRNSFSDWGTLAEQGAEIYTVPGDHLSYLREHVHTTAEQLQACLDKT
ncbi:MAG: amino acid adenylation domain-containing protein [Candidatus Electrothrix scaldis]|nr:MAG: amino acid adenylation domain-containing protein [Candidatus Electrothrix sp. GW3-3]